jgi:hypothetical protein
VISIVNSENNVVSPIPDHIEECIPGIDVGNALFNPNDPTIADKCYPLTTLVSYGVLKHYTAISQMGSKSNVKTQNCVLAEHSLLLLKWLIESTEINDGIRNYGVVRLSSNSTLLEIVHANLNAVRCDGKTILIEEPDIWKVSSNITAAIQAVGSIMLIAEVATLLIFIRFRQKSVLRSSSVAFMVIMLMGLMIFTISAILLALDKATVASCGAFIWLSALGFSATFAPLFIKTWRIWKIFERKHLRVVKITNRKLFGMLAAIFATDIILLAAWQGASNSLHPVTIEQRKNDNYDSYTHCLCDLNTALPFIVLLGGFKAALILFGAVMAFSTRKVETTFNESKSMAWAIYNLIMAVIIMCLLLAVTQAVGDLQIILIEVIYFWIIICTFMLIFLPKLQVLYVGQEIGENTSNNSSSFGIESKAFSFVQLAGMDRVTLTKYIAILTNHLAQARQRLVGMTGGNGGVFGKAGNNNNNTTNNNNTNTNALSATGYDDDEFLQKSGNGNSNISDGYMNMKLHPERFPTNENSHPQSVAHTTSHPSNQSNQSHQANQSTPSAQANQANTSNSLQHTTTFHKRKPTQKSIELKSMVKSTQSMSMNES